MKSKYKGILMMLICPVIWSLSGLLAKAVPWPGLYLAGVRGLLTAFSMFLYMRYAKLKVVVNKQSLGVAAGTAGCILMYFSALKLTTAANAIVLQYMEPVFLLILSAIFLKKRYTKADVAVVAATLGGTVLFFVGKLTVGDMWGNVLALLSGVSYATSYLFMTDADTDTRISGLMLGSLFAGVGVFTANPLVLTYTPAIVIAVVAAGLFQIAGAHIVLGYAMKLTTPLACSLIASLEIVFNPLWVYLFLGETPGLWSLVGGGIILAAITVWCIYSTKKYDPEGVT